MDEPEGTWVSLFSGGKDSSFALFLALERGLPVGRLITVHPRADSYMYHVPATDLAPLAAESIGIPILEIDPGEFEEGVESGARGDAELEPLEARLRELDGELAGGLGGIVAGAVESEYQTSRIEGMASRLGADLFAPLWRNDPSELAERMLEAGFEIVVVQVAADGLDESWLGRVLDREAFAELATLAKERGVHLLGEGGEFETIVIDGPHMDRPIDLTYEREWDGIRGRLRITDARLA